MSMATRGSESANEYANKKREQIEAAKRIREERKQTSLLKNVGEQFVLKPSSGSQQTPGGYGAQNAGGPMSTSSSGFSQKSGGYPPQGSGP